ncbi:hypothetical protein GFS31_00320 [Leptolyngbya sp. BL0902]|nr:hypothetical protein GFS31_00320 [Leptolyngbya sp. BL0902]
MGNESRVLALTLALTLNPSPKMGEGLGKVVRLPSPSWERGWG